MMAHLLITTGIYIIYVLYNTIYVLYKPAWVPASFYERIQYVTWDKTLAWQIESLRSSQGRCISNNNLPLDYDSSSGLSAELDYII